MSIVSLPSFPGGWHVYLRAKSYRSEALRVWHPDQQLQPGTYWKCKLSNPSQTYDIRTPGEKTQPPGFLSPPGDSDAHSGVTPAEGALALEDAWQCLETCSVVGSQGRWRYWASSGWRLGMLLNTSQCTGQSPTQRIILLIMSAVPRVRSPG